MTLTVSLSGGRSRSVRLPLRPCAGIVLFNAEGRVWLGRRRPKWADHQQRYVADHIWQFPQGGISRGERPLSAALRELHEETGVRNVKLLAEFPGWLGYELPRDLIGVALKGRFAGQRMRWFAMRFEGSDDEIDIAGTEAVKHEFDDWRWAHLEDAPALALPFKRPMYEAVIEVFGQYARPGAAETAA